MGSDGPYRGTLDRQLPEQWSDLTPAQVWHCMDLIITGAPRRQILDYLLELPAFMEELLSPAEVYDLLRVITWMQLDPASPSPVAPYIETESHGRLYLPLAKMEYTTCREYMLVDQVYEEYIQAQDPEVEMRLIALMLRPAGPSPYMASDPRILLQSEEHAAQWLPAVRELPDSIRVYMATLISAMRRYIYDTYHHWLFSPSSGVPLEEGQTQRQLGQGVPSGAPPEDIEEEESGLNFGWLGAFMDVASDGLFGPFEQVLDAQFHHVCIHMTRKVEEARLLRIEHDHARIRQSA